MDYKKLVDDLNQIAEMDFISCPDNAEAAIKAATAITDLLTRAEAAEAAQETLQRAMAEYKERAEKAETQAQVLETANKILTARITKAECRAERAEKCIAEIKSARDHTRPSYVVGEILRGFYDKKTFDELSKEAKKLYNDILTGESIKADT